MNCYTVTGFTENHSTDTCLSQLTDMSLNGAENGKHTCIIIKFYWTK